MLKVAIVDLFTLHFQYITDILTNLTPDDVRHLIQSEDEFTQRNNLEKIFPTAESSHYLDFFAGPRYYNRLFDAWEHKYSTDRSAGKHLIVVRWIKFTAKS